MSKQAAALDIDTFNKLVDYLSTRPYKDVSGLIEEIRNTTQLVDLQPENEETPSEE